MGYGGLLSVLSMTGILSSVCCSDTFPCTVLIDLRGRFVFVGCRSSARATASSEPASVSRCMNDIDNLFGV